MKNKDIARLVKRVKDRDEAAFDELYNRMWKSIYFLVYKRVKDYEDATDLTQEIFVMVSNEIHKLRDDAAFNMWINRMTVNHCSRYLSKRNRDVISIDEVANDVFEDRNEFLPEVVVSEGEMCQAISDVVSALPDEQRQAVLLYYYSGFSTNEISKILETSPNAVHLKLSRARAAIKSKVEKLRSNGAIMYSVAPLTLLTRIFTGEAEKICTAEIGDQILTGVHASLAAGITVIAGTAAGGAGASIATSILAKAGLGILSVAVIGGGAVLGYRLVKSEPPSQVIEPPSQVVVVESGEPGESDLPDKPITELEDFVGEEDAAAIRSWGELSTQNNNKHLIDIVERHGFTRDNIYVDNTSGDSSYLLFWLEKQDKRLLLCEYYNADTMEWGVVYSIEDAAEPIPQAESLKAFFADHSADRKSDDPQSSSAIAFFNETLHKKREIK